MRIALLYYVLGQMTSGVSISRDTSSTRGRAGGSPLTPLQIICFFQGRRLILFSSSFSNTFGGWIRENPLDSVKRGKLRNISGVPLFF
jgi:hypothetical protein